MLLRKIISVLLCSLLMIGCSQAEQPTFYDTDGNSFKLSNLKGKWVVVNYWAAWCSACVDEIPELNRFYQHVKDRNVVFIGVDYDELSLDNLKDSIASVAINYPVLTSDPGYAWNLESVNVIPTTFILNPEGKIVKVITGTNTERSLTNTILSLQKDYTR